jgi:hypothetical protein
MSDRIETKNPKYVFRLASELTGSDGLLDATTWEKVIVVLMMRIMMMMMIQNHNHHHYHYDDSDCDFENDDDVYHCNYLFLGDHDHYNCCI